MGIRIKIMKCAIISFLAFPGVSYSQDINSLLSLMLGLPVVTDSTTPSEPGTVNYLLGEFSEVTDIQRERWQENNEWEHHVSGKCKVHEITTTNWQSEIKSPEATFEVDCRISSDEHVILFYEKYYEDEMYSLSKGDVIEIEGQLKTIKHWGFWNSAYVFVEESSQSMDSGAPSDPDSHNSLQAQDHATREIISENSDQVTLVDGVNNKYEVTINDNGIVLKAEHSVIYMGKSCDTQSPQFGEGVWGWANGGLRIEFMDKVIGFPRQESPFPDSRCRI